MASVMPSSKELSGICHNIGAHAISGLDLHKIYEPGLRCEFDYKGRDKEFGYFDSVAGFHQV
jgi:hypothetical protein